MIWISARYIVLQMLLYCIKMCKDSLRIENIAQNMLCNIDEADVQSIGCLQNKAKSSLYFHEILSIIYKDSPKMCSIKGFIICISIC